MGSHRNSFADKLRLAQRYGSASGAQDFHIPVFETSYQERDGWSGLESGWFSEPDDKLNKPTGICAVNGSIDHSERMLMAHYAFAIHANFIVTTDHQLVANHTDKFDRRLTSAFSSRLRGKSQTRRP
ncbi:hypothetical protein [uncultured Bradyrhizobium sp.]|uniref:hypothetical protein n=1 Tax=Bradyrhizobium sp. TaxID=376 RepID=UPI0026390382|nr:hypothetical protein [uncultured Bradyrhizobium sp.]